MRVGPTIGLTVLLMVFLLIGAGSLSAIYFGWFPPKNNDSGATPRIPLLRNEKLVFVSRVDISGSMRAIWDVRDNVTNILKFMVLVDPSNGQVIRDQDIVSKAFAIRLALDMAITVNTLADKVNQAGQFATTIVGLGNIASRIASSLGEVSTVGAIERFTSSVADSSSVASAVCVSLSASSDSASRLTSDPSDQNADFFLTSLGASSLLTASQRAALIYLILSNSLQSLGLSPGPWLQSIYGFVTQGTQPSLSMVSMTFGSYESSQTTNALAVRGAF
jgi:hypothetical protein